MGKRKKAGLLGHKKRTPYHPQREREREREREKGGEIVFFKKRLSGLRESQFYTQGCFTTKTSNTKITRLFCWEPIYLRKEEQPGGGWQEITIQIRTGFGRVLSKWIDRHPAFRGINPSALAKTCAGWVGLMFTSDQS